MKSTQQSTLNGSGVAHARSIRALALVLGVLALQGRETAAAQCLRWDPIYSAPAGDAKVLRVVNLGTGPQLITAVDMSVRRWTGNSWVPPGSEDFDDVVCTLNTYDDGTGPRLFAGGYFQSSSATHAPLQLLSQLVNGVWSQVGGGLPALGGVGAVFATAVYGTGGSQNLYAAGGFLTNNTLHSNCILSWNGTSWNGVGGGMGPNGQAVISLCVFDDGSGPALFAGGTFSQAGGTAIDGIARWDGSSWSSLGAGLSMSGTHPNAYALATFDDGSGPALYVTGSFDHAGGVPVNGMARWNGTNWSALPGLSSEMSYAALGIAAHDDGQGSALYVGVTQVNIGSIPVHGVARWDGQSWSRLGGGYNGTVNSLTSFDDGQGAGPALWVGGLSTGSIGGGLPGSSIARWYGGCLHRIDALCFGDQSFFSCPCSNPGASAHGCGNSGSTQGALLSSSGTLSPDTLMLQSSDEPASSLSFFLQSDALRPFEKQFGHGILCIGGRILRMYAKSAAGGVVQAPEPGDLAVTQRSAALGDLIPPGGVRYYQVWYRDYQAGFCPAHPFNISNGLRVVW